MALTRHSQPKVHQRYVELANIGTMPAAAVPYLAPGVAVLVANKFRPKLGAKPGQNSLANPAKTTRMSLHCGTSSVGRARASQA